MSSGQCPACRLTHGRALRCRIAQRIAERVTGTAARWTQTNGPEYATGPREVAAAREMMAGYRAGVAVLDVHAGDVAKGRVPLCSALALADPAGVGRAARKAWGPVLNYTGALPAGLRLPAVTRRA